MSTRTTQVRRHRIAVILPAIAVLLAALVGCSDGGSTEDTDSTASGQAPAGGSQDRAPEGGGGTSGEIAAVTDSVMQVQGDSGQTAVTWTDSTTITETVAGALSDVTVGSCVLAMITEDVARTVTVSAADDGSCAGSPGGGGQPSSGELPGDMPDGELPQDLPSDLPEGGMPTGGPDGTPTAGGGFGGGQMTAGTVTAVDGDTITVDVVAVGDSEDTTSSTITVGADTTYATTQTADASAIVVGQCVAARGESDDKGQVTATSLSLSEPGDEGCAAGFGGGPGGRPGAGPGQNGAGSGDQDA